uniref:Uncharacterized protein n=1 Tax=Anguilla anguilla TaxID=7936 RepID=A0A0E9W060_ANGAN
MLRRGGLPSPLRLSLEKKGPIQPLLQNSLKHSNLFSLEGP